MNTKPNAQTKLIEKHLSKRWATYRMKETV